MVSRNPLRHCRAEPMRSSPLQCYVAEMFRRSPCRVSFNERLARIEA